MAAPKRRRRWSITDSDDDEGATSPAKASRPKKARKGVSSSTVATGIASLAAVATTSAVPSAASRPGPAPREMFRGSHNPLIHGCRSVDCYEPLNKIDEGSFGVVYRARDKETDDIVALKRVKMPESASREGFPITALRETNVLLSLEHENIVRVREMVVGKTLDDIYMVMEYIDFDLKAVLMGMKQDFSPGEVKCLFQQLLRAVAHLHEHWYIHRDLKTSNLLLDNNARLLVCDFGLARKYGDPIRPYTDPRLVVTRWYRPPELLLGQTRYTSAIDMWSVGCIFAELLTRKPLFPGRSDVEQLSLIFRILGTPTEEQWPGWESLPEAASLPFKRTKPIGLRQQMRIPVHPFSGDACLSDAGLHLLEGLLTFDPSKRLSAEEALAHPYFKELPTPLTRELMPRLDPRAKGESTRVHTPEEAWRGMFREANSHFGD